MRGTVQRLVLDRGFGFIKPDGGNKGEVFFHVRDMGNDLPFDEQLIERRVDFEVENTDRGQRCVNVRGL